MGFLCKTPDSTPTPTTQVVQNSIPGWLDSASQANVRQASDIANQPLQTYGGPRLAAFNPFQQQAFGQVQSMQGAWQPGQQAAYGNTFDAAQGFPGVNLSDYMNPYQQNVTDIAKREAIRDSSIAGQGLDAQASRAGAFGGSRHGLIQAERERNLGQRLADLQTTGSNAAFNQAAQLSQSDLNRRLAAGKQFSDLAGAGQRNALQDIAALQGAGDTQQMQEQRALDIPYQNFLEQRDYGRNNALFLNSIIRGIPMQSTQTSTGQHFTPQQSPLAAAAGAGIGAYSLWSMFNK